MPNPPLKRDVFERLGYGAEHDLLELALEEAGLSRPAKPRIAASKLPRARRILEDQFLRVCHRGDCRNESREVDDGRIVVRATSQEHCSFCGNARAIDDLVDAFRRAKLRRLCVVGGSPNARDELTRLVRGRLDLRLIDGTTARTRKAAEADLRWADRIALWGSTMLDHKVSGLYQGRPGVVQFARRSIQELARAVMRSVEE